jgi:CheY-like chemotaxis protein
MMESRPRPRVIRTRLESFKMDRRLKLLLVDDEPDLLCIAERALTILDDLDIRTASDGAQAIISAQEYLPDVIVMDLLMPGLDGEQAIEMLRQDVRTSNIPVILMTSIPDVGVALQIPDVMVIPKPFDPIQLNDLIKELATNRP